MPWIYCAKSFLVLLSCIILLACNVGCCKVIFHNPFCRSRLPSIIAVLFSIIFTLYFVNKVMQLSLHNWLINIRKPVNELFKMNPVLALVESYWTNEMWTLCVACIFLPSATVASVTLVEFSLIIFGQVYFAFGWKKCLEVPVSSMPSNLSTLLLDWNLVLVEDMNRKLLIIFLSNTLSHCARNKK